MVSSHSPLGRETSVLGTGGMLAKSCRASLSFSFPASHIHTYVWSKWLYSKFIVSYREGLVVGQK